MANPQGKSEVLQGLLDRLAGGDQVAADDLITHAMERLRRLTRKMLRDNPAVRRWEETDDVFQAAAIRLRRALKAVKPTSVKAFVGLAATQIRRELIDLARHHYGPEGDAAHHASDPGKADSQGRVRPLHDKADSQTGPSTLLQRQELHEHVQALPSEEREVVDLLFYWGLTQEEAAERLGVSKETVKRRSRSARARLSAALKATPLED